MNRSIQSTAIQLFLALAVPLLCAPAYVSAQNFMVFGDVETSLTDSIAGSNGTLSSLAGLNPNGQLLSGAVKLHMNQRLTFDSGELYVDDTLQWLSGSDGSALSNSLAEGYIAVNLSPELTVVVGKRRMSWGAGYAFFPGDKIDPALSPGNRSQGFYGLLATLAPSASFTLTGAVRFDTAFPELDTLSGFTSNGTSSASLPFLAPYVPNASENPWTKLRYALYADALIGKLDLYAATTYEYKKVLRPTLGFSYDLGGIIANGEAAVELSNSALYPDTTSSSYSSPAFGTPYPIVTVGLQRTVTTDTSSFSVTAEYLYDGTGYNSTQAKTFFDDLLPALDAVGGSTPAAEAQAAYAASDLGSSTWFSSGDIIPALGQHYAALSVAASVTNLFQATAAFLVNVQDGSFAVQPEFRITRLSGIDLFVRGVIAWGKNDHTEFGLVPTPVNLTTGAIVHF